MTLPDNLTHADIRAAGDAALQLLEDTIVARLPMYISEIRELLGKKGTDYSQYRPWANLRAAEEMGLSVAQGIVIRLGDKMERIRTLQRRQIETGMGPAVADEAILDTARDLLGYSLLLQAALRLEAKFPEAEAVEPSATS